MTDIVFILLAVLALYRIVVNARNYFAVFGGALGGLLLGLSFGFGGGFLYVLWMLVSGVVPGHAARQIANSIVLFLLCIAGGLFSTYFTGYIAGMIAKSDEILHACGAGIVFAIICTGSFGPADQFPPDSLLQSLLTNNILDWSIFILEVPLAGFGGHIARRSKKAAEEWRRRPSPIGLKP
ncbi:MAG: hypothetical protein HZA91_01140 [Verrucomicrobia bacterium]|nr:hypothetical protein [Verrucomicrobiota bacterium]